MVSPCPPSTSARCTLSAFVSAEMSSVTWATAQACSTSVRMPCGALGRTTRLCASRANAMGLFLRSLASAGPITHSGSSTSRMVWMSVERSAP